MKVALTRSKIESLRKLCMVLCVLISSNAVVQVSARPSASYITCNLTKTSNPAVSLFDANVKVMGLTPKQINSTDIDQLATVNVSSENISSTTFSISLQSPQFPDNLRFIVWASDGLLASVGTGTLPKEGACSGTQKIIYELFKTSSISLTLNKKTNAEVVVLASTGPGGVFYFQRFNAVTDDIDNSTHTPTFSPTFMPTESPSFSPTFMPTESPTFYPTLAPTLEPTALITSAPTSNNGSNSECTLTSKYATTFKNLIASITNGYQCTDISSCPAMTLVYEVFWKSKVNKVFLENCTALDVHVVSSSVVTNTSAEEIFVEECITADEFNFVFEGSHCEKVLKSLTVSELLRAFNAGVCHFPVTTCFSTLESILSDFDTILKRT